MFLSIRRGYWFVPKFIMGFPTGDVLSNVEMLPLPRLLKRWLFQGSLWLLQGPPSRYRMPDPDYAIDQAHPTMTDEIPRLVAHGKLTVKPEIAELRRRAACSSRTARRRRSTPSCSPPATSPVVPFIDESLIFAADGQPRFLLNAVHPEHEGLFAAGLAQANGSMWRLADYQGQLIANLIVAGQREPERARRFRDLLAERGNSARVSGVVASDRHRLEVNYYDYRRLLKRLMRRFGPVRKNDASQRRCTVPQARSRSRRPTASRRMAGRM